MPNITVIRKPSPRYANNISKNEDVGQILETQDEPWSTLGPKLHKVADFVPSSDFTSKSTVLGKDENFMKPFRDAIDTYNILYDSSEWTNFDENGILEPLEASPFRLRGDDMFLDPSFSEKISIPSSGKVIVIGDLHSGLQSLVQIIDDLVTREILSDDLQLKNGYTIIFLGDLLDRGGLGLEISHIVFRLKVINFQSIIIINGNHEDESMHSRGGFTEEATSQLSEKDRDLVFSLLTYLPTVVFMHLLDTDEWIQLNHGGIEPDYEPLSFIKSSFDYHLHGFDNGGLDLMFMGLRWNDFSGHVDGIGNSSRGERVFEYGKKATEEYLERNKLIGIIRGHQELTHFMALQRTNGSMRGLSPIEEVDMLTIQPNHWKNLLETGWEHIPLINTFKDFSVLTTSTANRARNLGMNVYLELTNSRDDFSNAQREIRKNEEDFIGFVKEIQILEEFQFMMFAGFGQKNDISEEKLANWNFTIDFMKEAQKDYAYKFFNWFILDSYGLFE